MIYISSDLYLHLGESEPALKYPRIGYLNNASAASASSVKTGYSASAVLNDFTYERWAPSVSPASLIIEADTAEDVNYVAIGAHTLKGFNVLIERSVDGIAYTTIQELVTSSNKAIMILFDKTPVKYIKITITGSGTPEIGVVYFGETLVMQRSIYSGHTPITLARETEKTPHISEAGEYLGTTIIRKGYASSYSFNNLKAEWYREYFDPFVEHAITKPFFIAWKPDNFINEVIFGWTAGDIKPANSGIRDYMGVSFDVRGYNEL
jgi:hypothetical protein